MEPKFRLETEMGYGEYRRFSRTVLLRVNHIALAALFMMAVLAVLSYLTWDAFYLILAVLVPAIFWLVIEYKTKKAYASNKAMQGMKSEYLFYDDHFEAKSSLGTSEISYGQLYLVLETKEDFYLMIGRNQGCALEKSRFPDGLSEFLRGLPRHKKA